MYVLMNVCNDTVHSLAFSPIVHWQLQDWVSAVSPPLHEPGTCECSCVRTWISICIRVYAEIHQRDRRRIPWKSTTMSNPKASYLPQKKNQSFPTCPTLLPRLDEPTEGVKQEWDFMFNSCRYAKDWCSIVLDTPRIFHVVFKATDLLFPGTCTKVLCLSTHPRLSPYTYSCMYMYSMYVAYVMRLHILVCMHVCVCVWSVRVLVYRHQQSVLHARANTNNTCITLLLYISICPRAEIHECHINPHILT